MNSNCLLAFTEVMTYDRMRQSYAQSHSVLQWWFIADTISTETGTTVEQNYCKLEYFTEFYLFQAWPWRLTMLQIYVTLWGRWFVCVCVCVSAYLVLLSHILPFKIHLTNISPILIKMVDFKNLAWATSFATWASRKFIYRASGKRSYCYTLDVLSCCCTLSYYTSSLVFCTHTRSCISQTLHINTFDQGSQPLSQSCFQHFWPFGGATLQ